MIPLLMIHGVCGDGTVFNRMAALYAAHGFLTRTPTLFADLRVNEAPGARLAALTLRDYVEAMAAEARGFERETGQPVVLLGHSMGGLIVQKLAAMGIGRAGVLVTPAPPADCITPALSQLVTFWNVIRSGDVTRGHKIWRTGFDWGVLNQVPKERRDAIYARLVFDSGQVFRDLGRPKDDPHHTAVIDAADVKIPLLAIAAGRDRAIPAAAVRKIARKYRASGSALVEYPRHGHWIVDEVGTERVVADSVAWLKQKLARA